MMIKSERRIRANGTHFECLSVTKRAARLSVSVAVMLLFAVTSFAQVSTTLPSGSVPYSNQIYRKISAGDTTYYTGASGKGFVKLNGYADVLRLQDSIADLRADKVDKVAGKSLISDSEITRLLGMATGATANSTDAQLRDRATHTGTQAPGTIVQDASNRFVTDAEKIAWNGKQDALGFTPENSANKATDFSVSNNTLYPTVQAAKTYMDGLVVGLLNDRGSYDPTITSAYPASGGSGTAGAIKKGDIWYISVAGTMGSQSVYVGASVRALADSPGQTAGSWNILNVGLGYIPENVANKVTDLTSPDNTKYPTSLAISTALGLKLNSSSYTAADVISKILTVDGAGSGLDADLFDGQSSTFYTDIVARLGYTPYNATNPDGFLPSSTAAATYEPLFSKNTGFNKNFGTTAGTVAQGDDSRITNGQTAFSWGNHASAGYYSPSNPQVNITGNAATADLADNSTLWAGRSYVGADIAVDTYTLGLGSDGQIHPIGQANFRTFLGLGSNAYTSTAYLPIAGGTLTGGITINSGGITVAGGGATINSGLPVTFYNPANTSAAIIYNSGLLRFAKSDGSNPMIYDYDNGNLTVPGSGTFGGTLNVNGSTATYSGWVLKTHSNGVGAGIYNKGLSTATIYTDNASTVLNAESGLYLRTGDVDRITINSSAVTLSQALTAPQGTFTDGTQGLQVQAYTGGGGLGAIYSTGVTPNSINYLIAGSPTNSYFGGGSITANNTTYAVTLAGALTGTSLSMSGSGTFGGDITISKVSALLNTDRTATNQFNGLRLKTNGTNNWGVGSAWGSAGTSFDIYNYNTGTLPLSIDYSTNATTLTGALTAPSATFNGTGIGAFNAQLRVINTTASPALIEFGNSANGFSFGFSSTGTQRFVWYNGAPTEIMSLNASGELTATSFSGAGTGLTGTASGLNIGGDAGSVDGQSFSYSNDSNTPTYIWATNSSGASFLASRASLSVSYADNAGSAGAVAWTNVSGRPTALSSFTNDLGNYGGWITPSSTENLTNKSGNISMWNNDMGYLQSEDVSGVYLPATGWTNHYLLYGNSSGGVSQSSVLTFDDVTGLLDVTAILTGSINVNTDVEILQAANGIVLTDTNDVRYRITVNTSGALVVTAL